MTPENPNPVNLGEKGDLNLGEKEAEATLSELQKRIQNFLNTKETLEKEIQKLTKDQTNAQEGLSKILSKIDQASSHIPQKNEEFKDIERKLQESQEAWSKVEATLNARQKRIEQIKRELADLEVQKEKALADVATIAELEQKHKKRNRYISRGKRQKRQKI